MARIARNSHFLGAKLRALRKQNRMTLEELSMRCIQIDAQAAPSVSYLSMIESGQRVPSEDVLLLIAKVFQRDSAWFFDQNADIAPVKAAPGAGGAARVPLEPSFLFSRELLQSAIPELLVADRHLRAPVRASADPLVPGELAQRVSGPGAGRRGSRQARVSADRRRPDRAVQGAWAELRWFERKPVLTRNQDREVRSMVRSFFEPPGTVFLNKALQSDPARLKFDLASHIAHKVLHGGDGMKSPHATGGEMGGSPESGTGHHRHGPQRTCCTPGAISSAASSPARCCVRSCLSGGC